MKLDARQRRARLGARHVLGSPAASGEDVAGALVGLHSSDPPSVYLSAWARVASFKPGDLEDALYGRRSLVRMLGMRRTLFVVPRAFVPVMFHACTRTYAAPERRRVIGLLEEAGVAKRTARWLERVENETLEALAMHGPSTAREVTREVPELGHRFEFGQGKRWAGTVGLSTRLLFLLATEGRVLRARPTGAWTAGQYRWARVEDWLGAPIPELDPADARAELLTAYLRGFGPATLTDIRWWTGWTAKDAREALRAVDAREVRVEGDGTGYLNADDELGTEEPAPWVALLPSLDPTVMGWKERGWYLGERGGELFDRAGNPGPQIWAGGRVVGGWQQRPSGEIAVAYLERVEAKTKELVDTECELLRGWLGDVRIKPRFPTPFHALL